MKFGLFEHMDDSGVPIVVPITLGKRLYGLLRTPKRFVRIAGGGHNDLGSYAVAAAKRFIAEQPAA